MRAIHRFRSIIVATAAAAMLTGFAPGRIANAQVVYSNLPNRSNGSEMTRWIQAEDFTLNSATTLTAIRFWSIEGVDAYHGSISYNIYANSGSNTPGAILLTGTTSSVTRTLTGQLVTGALYPEIINDFAVSLSLPAGTYWLGLHNGPFSETNAEGGNPFAWETANLNETVRGMEDEAPFDSAFTTNSDEHAFVLSAGETSSSAAPEPSTLTLLATAGLFTLILVAVIRRSKRRSET